VKFSSAVLSALPVISGIAKNNLFQKTAGCGHSINGSHRRKPNFIEESGEDYQRLPAKKNP
jgi:hypothetical protein